MAAETPDKPEKLGPNNGRVVAWLALGLGGIAVVMILADGTARANLVAATAVLLVLALVWAVMLRPAVFVDTSSLRLRNAFSDVVVPIASVDGVTVRQVMVVYVGDRTLQCTALTRHRRELTARDQGKKEHDPLNNYADFVEDRIKARADDARARGDDVGSVVRRPARVEIGSIVAVAVVLAVLLVL